MKLGVIALFILFFFVACTSQEPTTNAVVDNSPKPITFEQFTLHTIDHSFPALDCPNRTIESYAIVKMSEIVAGNLTLKEVNSCSNQNRFCTGKFDISEINTDRCWKLQCHVERVANIGETGAETIEYKPCNYIKFRNTQNIINTSEEISWEILPL